MTLRTAAKKWILGSWPGVTRRFWYFGCRVYFPKRSFAFYAACEQGVFEQENVVLLQKFCEPETVMFDVGANIGLMAIPVLNTVIKSRVVSFEPSPNALPWLTRTVRESPFDGRWSIVSKAVGDETGQTTFTLMSPEFGSFDGVKPTNRVAEDRSITVEVTTVDTEWKLLGQPKVSVLKVDVEGAELAVLRGAAACIASDRPHILCEWNSSNLKVYNCPPESLLAFAKDHNYRVFGIPRLSIVTTDLEMTLQMLYTESFFLVPE